MAPELLNTAKTPLVSIGLPVFNGEAYVDLAIRAHVEQTATDFELILADNASTDATSDICRRWSERDPRVRWVRTEAHTGAARNFNRAFGLARGRYFRWAAHDDLVEPTYVERCLELLESDPDVVLAHSQMVEIDENGEELRPLDAGMEHATNDDTARRFKGAIALDHGCFDVFGLVRRGALERTQLIAPYLGSDRVLLAELALMGKLVRADEVLFKSREHPQRSIRMRSDADRARWFASGKGDKRMRPNWRRLRAVREALARADVSPITRLRCKAAIAGWANSQRGSLVRELVGRERPGDIREKAPPPPSIEGDPQGQSESAA